MPRRSNDYLAIQKKLANANHEIFTLKSVAISDTIRIAASRELIKQYKDVIGAYQEALGRLEWKDESTKVIIHRELNRLHDEAKGADLIE